MTLIECDRLIHVAVMGMSLDQINDYLRSRITADDLCGDELRGICSFAIARAWLRDIIIDSALVGLVTLVDPRAAISVAALCVMRAASCKDEAEEPAQSGSLA